MKGLTDKVLLTLLAVLALALQAGLAAAQDSYTYNQYMNNLTPLNPAYSLIDKASNINLTGRKQWVGIEGAPETFLLNGSIPLNTVQGSAGLIVEQDKVAIENLTEVKVFFAKGVQLSDKNYLGVSFNAGLRNYTANYNEISSTDPRFKDNIRETIGIVGFGVMLYNPEKYYVSASIPSLSMRSLGKGSVEKKRNYSNNFYFAGACLLNLDESLVLKPAALISNNPGLALEADVSTILFLKRQLGLGISYRTTNEIGGMLSYIFKNNIQIGYSYQKGAGTQNIGSAGSGTHEITLGMRFGKGLNPELL